MGQLVTRRGGLGWGSSRGGTFRWLWRARVGSPYSPLWHLLLPIVYFLSSCQPQVLGMWLKTAASPELPFCPLPPWLIEM